MLSYGSADCVRPRTTSKFKTIGVCFDFARLRQGSGTMGLRFQEVS